MAPTGTIPAPGPLFWQFLVVIPGAIALAIGLYFKSIGITAHAFVFACFSLASVQCLFFSWWRRNVEGDLGMPKFVHLNSGATELVIITLRAYALSDSNNDNGDVDVDEVSRRNALAVATILTCGMMGGARWTWFVAVKKPLCFVPAALILVATIVTRPPTLPALDAAAFAAFLTGNVVAAKVWHFYNDDDEKQRAD
eukprot:CAMPEP_0116999158 /NCGR_PEP_ID=MMETSP0472-20121206/1975_1 /TAXON_ID=693140 ORGANISM="Tiarina fusus, Strain LIS" /NCGR_SAMPLE_ID=MMETSP0472 /ASSEMBLY_ACC=CAM_ASM_000603 /LENGTH=196 /DNA_ID=CAMNT_0004698521 /DNA_START=28 /DNA_END=618 /DNA_ORIENTATION=-